MKPRAPHHPWLFIGPSLAHLSLFFVAPIFVALVASFFEWDLLTRARWVGLANYVELASGGQLFWTVARTLTFSAMVVATATALGLGLALLLHRRGTLFAFARGAIFSAYVVSWVAVALLWLGLLDPDAGILAKVVARFGVRLAFLTDPNLALIALALVTVWKVTGYSLVILLGALDSIPTSFLEAAALDGAGPWDRLRYVILPQIRPTAAFVMTTSLVASFQAFDVVRIMTQGGPAKSTTLLVYAIYEQVFLNLSVGKASAIVVVFFALLFVLSTLQLALFREKAGSR